MAVEYKVKLGDGNEYGPADEALLKQWFQDGRLAPGSLLQALDGASWAPLESVFDLKTWERPAAPEAPPAAAAPAPRPRPRPPLRAPAPPKPMNLWPFALAAILLVGVVGGVLGWRFLVPPQSETAAVVSRWAAPEKTLSDDSLGISMTAPRGFVFLKKDNPLIVAPDALFRLADAKGVLAQIRYASLPSAPASLDSYLDRLVEARQRVEAGFHELGRVEGAVPGSPSRRMTYETSAQKGAVTVAADGWIFFELAAWCPAAQAGDLPGSIEALEKAMAVQGLVKGRIAAAVPPVLEDAPQLSKAAAALLVRDGLSRGLAPAQIAEASFSVASKGFPTLSPSEIKEVGDIFNLVYKPMSDKDKKALAAYLERVKAGRPGSADDEAENRDLMKNGILSLPDDSRARLQEIFEKAVAAGLASR